MFPAGSRKTTFTSLLHLAYITECQCPHLKNWLNLCGLTEREEKEREEETIKNEARLKFTMSSVACQNLMA